MTEIGTLLQDRYLIKEKIGTGGMGAVYLGIDKRFDNCVAIKETFYKQDEFGEAFEREARLLNGLQHPVLPHVSDYFPEKDSYFLVMQYIEGEDLSDILKREGAFPVEDVLRWTDSLLDALDYLHSQEPPVIHRDIKPHNLKLTPRGDILLLDFGLAKINQKDVSEVSVFGYSRTYSPLEQIQGTGTDARSDIFALGATAYHLISGKAPVNALTRAAAIVNGEKDPLPFANEIRPEISESITSVINTALALNPQNRFLSANAMRLALEYAVSETSNVKAGKNMSLPASAGAASGQIIDTAGNRNFPALESFAAAKNALDDEQPKAAEITSNAPNKDSGKLRPADSSAAPIIVDIPTKVSGKRENTQSRFIWAATAVLLFFGIAAAFYFGSRSNSADGKCGPITRAWITKLQIDLRKLGAQCAVDGLIDKAGNAGGNRTASISHTDYAIRFLNNALRHEDLQVYKNLTTHPVVPADLKLIFLQIQAEGPPMSFGKAAAG